MVREPVSVYEALRAHILDGDFPPARPWWRPHWPKNWASAARRYARPCGDWSRTCSSSVFIGDSRSGRAALRRSEIYEVRIVLEGIAARAASERFTEIDRIRLRQLPRARPEQSAPSQELAALNLQFHKRYGRRATIRR